MSHSVDGPDDKEELTSIEARFTVPRPTVHRPSADPYIATWRELQRLNGEDAVKDLVLKPRGLESDEQRRLWVRRCIRLAESFFNAFYEAEDLIDPVLLYYGDMWLAKAMIYTMADPSVLASRWDVHGVSPANDGHLPTRLFDWRVRVRPTGIVPTLCDILGGDDIRNTEITIEELLRAVTDILPLLKDAMQWSPVHQDVTFASEEPFGVNGFTRVLYWSGPLTTDTDFDKVALLAPLYRKLPGFHISGPINGVGEMGWRTWGLGETAFNMYTISGQGGTRYLECRLPCGAAIPEPVVLLILQHTISEYARYVPDVWLTISDEYTTEYAIIREFIETSYMKFPLITLNELTWRNYSFEAKA